MHIKPYLFAFFVVVFSTLSQVAFSHEITNDVFEKIICNEAYCVKDYNEDRVYLNAENLYPTNDGMFLDLDGHNYVELISLQSDGHGCSVPNLSRNVSIYKNCRLCGELYLIRCKNPNCPSNKDN